MVGCKLEETTGSQHLTSDCAVNTLYLPAPLSTDMLILCSEPVGRKVNHEKSFRHRIPLHRRASTQYLVHKKERVVLSYQKKVRRWLCRQFLVCLCFILSVCLQS